MKDAERREAARKFYYKWKEPDKGQEKIDCHPFWIEIFQNILGVENVTERIEFEKPIVSGTGSTNWIDVYVKETKTLIEQKSRGIPLDKPQPGHGGKTPYEQAKDYDNSLSYGEKARWIVLSNFDEIWIYDMEKVNHNKPEPAAKLGLMELQAKYAMLDFLVEKETVSITDEMKVSLAAGELVGKIYDALLKQYKNPDDPGTLISLNKLCVRLVFCLYAEDACVFSDTKKNVFHEYMKQFAPSQARIGLRNLFRVLNQKPQERDPYLADDDPLLAAFPYVNGGLFEDDDIEIPPFTEEIMDLLLQHASDEFDWSDISPTIFGAVFESTLNPVTRREGGMHYTSIENIHKVIDPLFLDELKAELEKIKGIAVEKTRDKQLREYQDKLTTVVCLDPAAGSGNFLTESFLCLRKLENEVIGMLQHGQMGMADQTVTPIKVSISQFYGIEINDFAVTVAKTALWIAEIQMMRETAWLLNIDPTYLPLKTNANIVEANALRIDWADVVPKDKLRYIMGNPPFVGQAMRSKSQSDDMVYVFGSGSPETKQDYVICWYRKAIDYMLYADHPIYTAFVSTNSICQGESVPTFWKGMVEKGAEIVFSYRTFVWSSEASEKAAVHCVIVGFTLKGEKRKKLIFDNDAIIEAEHINPYLREADDIWINNRSNFMLFDNPKMVKGSEPTDGGNLFLSEGDKLALESQYPVLKKYIKPFLGGREFLNEPQGVCNRYCLWFKGGNPKDYVGIQFIKERLEKIRDIRQSSSSDRIRKMADFPYLFCQDRQSSSSYMIIPRVSSENRRYIPFGFVSSDIICGDTNYMIPEASEYMFGVMISNVHMAWVRVTCGRLKSDYRYSPSVYNNFPWPDPTPAQKEKIEQTAQAILDARALYPDSSLADLYDPLTMPPELLKAHQANDRAVMQAYGMPIKETDEAACVAWLMRLYQQKVAEQGK